MTKHLLRKRKIKCHKENGPVNGMESYNVLSYKMQIRRPVFIKAFCGISVSIIADTGDIVAQSIKPHINHVLGVKVHRNTPVKGCS